MTTSAAHAPNALRPIKPGPSSESVLGCSLTMHNSHDFVPASAAAGYRCRTGSGDHGALASLLRRQRSGETRASRNIKAIARHRARNPRVASVDGVPLQRQGAAQCDRCWSSTALARPVAAGGGRSPGRHRRGSIRTGALGRRDICKQALLLQTRSRSGDSTTRLCCAMPTHRARRENFVHDVARTERNERVTAKRFE